MLIEIRDDFNLRKIVDSGQCFRPLEIKTGTFRFIVGEKILYIREIDSTHYDIDCSLDEWRFWENYFDLGKNYAEIRDDIAEFADDKSYKNFLIDATNFGKGIRILNQQPLEMLISFIISQRKNIPAIRSSIEKFCIRFGRQQGDIYFFPQVEEISDITLDDLKGLGLAYRKAYILDAIRKISSNEINLSALKNLPTIELVLKLKTIHGVGDKIANCVALFAYHRVDRVPIDVWIKRAIDNDFAGENIFDDFGKNAGILQQYIFFYKRAHK